MATSKILYKYVSATRFDNFWKEEKLRFTQLSQLNDPYENQFLLPNSDFNFNIEKLKEILVKTNETAISFKASLTHYEKIAKLKREEHCKNFQEKINNDYGILSLTRNYFNLLMWSHYAEEHRGVVIGFDMEHDFFRNSNFLIPPNTGNVIYTTIKPTENIIQEVEYKIKDKSKGVQIMISSPDLNDQIYQEFAFLHKSIDWAYEEEVRIVQDFNSDKSTYEIKLDKNGNKIYLYRIPKEAIKCLIFGARYNPYELEKTANEIFNNYSKIDIFKASIDKTEYRLVFNKYTPD